MDFVSFFSGIGAFDHGLERAGHRCVLQVEKDPACVQVLQEHFLHVPLLHDVASVLPCMIPKTARMLVAGFPCQDVSPANPNRSGVSGKKTSLCSHIFRILQERSFGWVVLENVPGILHRNGDEFPMRYVVESLENLGYSWCHRVVDLAHFGLPQRRRRVFVVASMHGDPRDVLLSDDACCDGRCVEKLSKPCFACFSVTPYRKQQPRSLVVDLSNQRASLNDHYDIIPTVTTRNASHLCIIQTADDVHGDALWAQLETLERAFGLPNNWTACLMTSGVRFRVLGLAVGVPVATWLGENLKRPYEKKFLRAAEGRAFTSETKTWPTVAWNILPQSNLTTHETRFYMKGFSEAAITAEFTSLTKFFVETSYRVDQDRAFTFLELCAQKCIPVTDLINNALTQTKKRKI